MTDTTVEIPAKTNDDAPVSVAMTPPTSTPSPTPIVTADEGIESLKEQVARAQRDSANRLAEKDRVIADAFKRASDAEREVTVVKKDQVGTIIDSLMKDKEAARRDYQAAMEGGDYAKAADAQDRLSLSNARIVEAERGKLALEDEAKNHRPVAVQSVTDPVETMAGSLSPRSASWVRSHPDYARDPRLTRQMVRAHEDAIDEGHAPDSDGYFGFIETKLGVGRPQRQESGRDMNRAPVAAPVGRDIAQAPGQNRPGTVTLSPNEVRAAMDTLSPLYPDASRDELLRIYAKNRSDLISEGRMQRAS